MAFRRLGDLIGRYLGLGGATGDSANPLSVRGPGSLHDGHTGGHQMRVNKAAVGDDAAMALQQGLSTHALIGLLANNDLTFKVGASSTTALVIDNTTGEVSMPATSAAKFCIHQSGRVYLIPDARWVTAHDDVYGAGYYQNAESAWSAPDPVLEWEHMGEYVRAGTVVHDLSIFGRVPDRLSIADVELYVVYVSPAYPDRWNGETTTGIDGDAEVLSTVLWRGMWKAGTATVGPALNAYSGFIDDQIRRKLDLDFTVPSDGQLRIYFKPVNVDPRPNASNDYMYQSHSWCLSYA